MLLSENSEALITFWSLKWESNEKFLRLGRALEMWLMWWEGRWFWGGISRLYIYPE